jgi:hypothetical protein
MKLTAQGKKRSVKDHDHEYRSPRAEVGAPGTPDETAIVISGIVIAGSVFDLGLGVDFDMQIRMSLQEFCGFAGIAAARSEAASSLLKAAVANGDVARAGIRTRRA